MPGGLETFNSSGVRVFSSDTPASMLRLVSYFHRSYGSNASISGSHQLPDDLEINRIVVVCWNESWFNVLSSTSTVEGYITIEDYSWVSGQILNWDIPISELSGSYDYPDDDVSHNSTQLTFMVFVS